MSTGITRKRTMVCGHFLAGTLLILVGLFLQFLYPDIMVVCLCFLMIVYQATEGALFWIYTGEIASDVALGISGFVYMMTLLLVLHVTPILVRTTLDYHGLLYILGGFKLVFPFLITTFTMKETKNLRVPEKEALYRPKQTRNYGRTTNDYNMYN